MKVRVTTVNPGLGGVVELDGQRIKRVKKVLIDDEAGRVPRVTLDILATGGLIYEGDAQVRIRLGDREYRLVEEGGSP